MSNIYKVNNNIYITSDEEIKEGDWFIANQKAHKCIRVDSNTSCPFITLNDKGEEIGHFHTWKTKIILTTDQDLIKDGVQAIDKLKSKELFKESNDRARKMLSEVKSLPILETLEEAACLNLGYDFQTWLTIHSKDKSTQIYTEVVNWCKGAKWQQEQILQFLYSEITERRPYSSSKMCEVVIEFIEQFKK
jgi:hypothetical protein